MGDGIEYKSKLETYARKLKVELDATKELHEYTSGEQKTGYAYKITAYLNAMSNLKETFPELEPILFPKSSEPSSRLKGRTP